MNLEDYRKGDKGTIVKNEGDPDFRKRIVEMGFLKETKVETVKYAPLEGA